MTPSPRAQRGLTLMELLIAMTIATLLIAPLGAAVLSALRAQSLGGGTNDLAQQARFAMQRMEAAVRRTAPHTLAAKNADTSGDWLAPALFCMRNATTLHETATGDGGCVKGSDIAESVQQNGFSMQTYSIGAGAAPVIEIQLTLTRATGESASLTSRTRLGGGAL